LAAYTKFLGSEIEPVARYDAERDLVVDYSWEERLRAFRRDLQGEEEAPFMETDNGY
jgi:hypothetical protein